MNDEIKPPRPAARPPRRWPLPPRRLAFAAALLAACAVGAGAVELAQHSRHVTVIALAPGPIADMKPGRDAAIKGQVADVFGGRFVVGDASGRALVDTGPGGEDGRLVAPNETVIVQGRFEHGALHAVSIQHADGRTDVVGPPPPPHRGPLALLGGGEGPPR